MSCGVIDLLYPTGAVYTLEEWTQPAAACHHSIIVQYLHSANTIVQCIARIVRPSQTHQEVTATIRKALSMRTRKPRKSVSPRLFAAPEHE
jgi:hypothetical protein